MRKAEWKRDRERIENRYNDSYVQKKIYSAERGKWKKIQQNFKM